MARRKKKFGVKGHSRKATRHLRRGLSGRGKRGLALMREFGHKGGKKASHRKGHRKARRA